MKFSVNFKWTMKNVIKPLLLCYSRGGKCEDLSPELHEKESKVSRTSRNSMYPSAQIKMRWVSSLFCIFFYIFTLSARFPVGKWKGGWRRHERQATVRAEDESWPGARSDTTYPHSARAFAREMCLFVWNVRERERKTVYVPCMPRACLSNCAFKSGWCECERAASRLSTAAAAAIPVRPIRANALLILINARSRSLPFNYI